MAINICIPKDQMDIVEREILNLPSNQRLAKFQARFGNEIGNTLAVKFEKSLLNRKYNESLQPFIQRFSKRFTELSESEIKDKATKIAERLATKEGNLTREDLLAITKDFVDRKYKTSIDIKEAENIAKYKKQASELKEPAFKTPEGSPERLAYGRAMSDYKDSIRQAADIESRLGLKDTLLQRARTSGENIKTGTGITGKVANSVREAFNLFTSAANKGFQASADVSYLLRQGRRGLIKNPSQWFDLAGRTIKNMAKTFGSKLDEQTLRQVRRDFEAEIFSSDFYELAVKHKLAVTGITEDYFVDSIAEKVPGLGKIIAASDNAFSEFSQLTRMRMFSQQAKRLMESGPVDDSTLTRLADYVNSFTGRGSFGGAEKYSSALNRIFYSARYMKSNYDYLTKWLFEKDPAIRKMYQKDLAKDFAVMATTLLTLKNVFGVDVELDPRSSRFGHVKVGDRWFDMTAGLSSFITLGTRGIVATGASGYLGGWKQKEASKNYKGKITGINTGEHGSPTYLDALMDFGMGKTSPTLNAALQVARGEDYQGKQIDITDFPKKYGATFLPLTASKTAIDLYQNPEDFVKMLGYGLAEASGISVKK